MSSQCVCVNTGEGTQIRAFPGGALNYSYDEFSCSQPELRDAFSKVEQVQ